MTLCHLGAFDQALACVDSRFRAEDELSHYSRTPFAALARGIIALAKGDVGTAISPLEQAVNFAVEGEYRIHFPIAAAQLGHAYLLAGRTEEAASILREAVRQARPTGTWCSLLLGEVCLRAGRIDEARQLAERSLSTALRTGERGTHALSLWLLGEIAATFQPVDAGTAEDTYREALALADELGMRPLVAHCHLGLGKLYRRTGKRQEAQEHLTTATTMYREMDMRFYLEQAEAAMREMA
jgi:tetratricopeptide (TPR) repeat protein